MENKLELRHLHLEGCELRAASEGRTLRGYAVVYNQPSEMIQDRGRTFRERILPGAFSGTLQRGDDVRALAHHNGDHLLGRTSSRTLRLSEDNHGLAFSLSVPNTMVGNDILELVRRGDLRGMSFGFSTTRDHWPAPHQREVVSAELREISVVAQPAYPQTSVEARSAEDGVQSFGIYRSALSPIDYSRSRLDDGLELERQRLRIRLARLL